MNELDKISTTLMSCDWSNVSIGNKAIILAAINALGTCSTHIEELQAKMTCMCGETMDHSPWIGHSPVSMFDHAVEQEVSRRLAAERKRCADIARTVSEEGDLYPAISKEEEQGRQAAGLEILEKIEGLI